jgi:hypothetical protein
MHEHRFDPEITEAVADVVRDWPAVHYGKIFGHPGWFAGRKLFALIDGRGVGLLHLSEDARAMLTRDFGAGPFLIQGSPTSGWILVPAPEVETVLALGPWLHDAYEAARELGEPG